MMRKTSSIVMAMLAGIALFSASAHAQQAGTAGANASLLAEPLKLSLIDPSINTLVKLGDESSSDPTANSQNQANNPLTPKITLNLQNYYLPAYYGLDNKQSDQLLFRGTIPHKLFGVPQLFRFTLPVATAPDTPNGYATGLGDFTLIDYFVFKGSGLEFGAGPVLVAPTATDSPLGQGKWQIGVSGLAISPQKWGILGGVVTFQQSFAGDSHRDDVTALQFQPLAIYNLPEGFYLRSTAICNFDFNNGRYYIPVGLGVGKVMQFGGLNVNAFVEPQYTFFHDGVAPQWQIFTGINFQF